MQYKTVNNNDTSRAVPLSKFDRTTIDRANLGQRNATKFQESASQGLLTYNDPVLGISISYPGDWSLRQYAYNPAVNNTLVGLYSPSKTSSELGNISGVSGNFVPYLDILFFSFQ